QEVAFTHIVVSDIRDVDIQQSVVVVIAPIRVHSFLGIKSDRGLGFVAKRSVTVVQIKPVGPEIIGDIKVFVAIVVRIAVPEIERPAGRVNSNTVGDFCESAILIIVKDHYTTTVVGILKTFRKKPRRAGMKNVDRLEVATEKQVYESVIVVVECDCF